MNASFHHNLMAHHDSRTPRYGPGARYVGTETTDVRNNVFYNWSGNGCYGGEGMSVNIVNNYYKPGPAIDSDKLRLLVMAIDIKRGETGDFAPINDVPGSYYLSGNYFPNDPEVSADNWKGVRDNTGWGEAVLKAHVPCTTEPLMVEHTAQIAYERVLSYAGCSRSRDEIDRRIVQETATGTATYKGLSEHNGKGGDWKSTNHSKMGILDSQEDLKPEGAGNDWSPWPVLKCEEPLLDTDGDGMPDVWEIANGLDPYTPDANGRHLSTGYDNIEVYINSLVEDITRLQYQ
ncbi:MAG: hypothetical protein LUF85_05700 [Bacteroides sp.]|nr:hypothetical protein [Bacteroides sp.]